MALNDKKIVATLIHHAAAAARQLQTANENLQAVKTAYTSRNPSVTGTPLQGRVSAVNAWIAAVNAAATDPVADELIAADVPTHRGVGLEV